MPDWADIYEPDYDTRMDLQRKALFFIPRAREVMDERKTSVAGLASYASTLRQKGDEDAAGRNAIKKIWDCEPVVYQSAVGFIKVANDFYQGTVFSKPDIVACIFKIKNFLALMESANLDADAIAKRSSVPLRIVKSAQENFRVSYCHAEALFRICGGADRTINDFAHTQLRNDSRANVKKDDDGYVYRRDDLVPAPRNGHPWSIS